MLESKPHADSFAVFLLFCTRQRSGTSWPKMRGSNPWGAKSCFYPEQCKSGSAPKKSRVFLQICSRGSGSRSSLLAYTGGSMQEIGASLSCYNAEFVLEPVMFVMKFRMVLVFFYCLPKAALSRSLTSFQSFKMSLFLSYRYYCRYVLVLGLVLVLTIYNKVSESWSSGCLQGW